MAEFFKLADTVDIINKKLSKIPTDDGTLVDLFNAELIDQAYGAESPKAQSGKAVAEAIEQATSAFAQQIPEVDQTFDPESLNAQSGVAIDARLQNISIQQKPWDINENVGSIVLNPITFNTSSPVSRPGDQWELVGVDDTDVSDYDEYRTYRQRKVIPVINSGKVFLRYDLSIENMPYTAHRTPYENEYIRFRIYTGNVVYFEIETSITHDGFKELQEGIPEEILLELSKGADIILEIEYKGLFNSEKNQMSGDHWGYFIFRDIHLAANIDTAYKYFALEDDTSTENVIELALSTLLGV